MSDSKPTFATLAEKFKGFTDTAIERMEQEAEDRVARAHRILTGAQDERNEIRAERLRRGAERGDF